MDNDFFMLLSNDACKTYYPSNNATDFTINLPSTLNFTDPGWRCGLCEIECYPNPKTPKSLFLLTDICEETIVNNQKLPLLRMISLCNYKITRKPLTITYSNVFYRLVKRQSIDQLRIYIKDVSGESLSVELEKLTCTLHFKRSK